MPYFIDPNSYFDHVHPEYSETGHVHLEYAQTDHTHSEYAQTDHTHSEYAQTDHTHPQYAETDHTHSEYAQTDHTHSEYAQTDHTHPQYAQTDHIHEWSEIDGNPFSSINLSANTINLPDYRLRILEDPIGSKDAVNKIYVDDRFKENLFVGPCISSIYSAIERSNVTSQNVILMAINHITIPYRSPKPTALVFKRIQILVTITNEDGNLMGQRTRNFDATSTEITEDASGIFFLSPTFKTTLSIGYNEQSEFTNYFKMDIKVNFVDDTRNLSLWVNVGSNIVTFTDPDTDFTHIF